MLKMLLEKQPILKLEPAGEKRTIDRKWNGRRRKLTRFTFYYKLFFFYSLSLSVYHSPSPKLDAIRCNDYDLNRFSFPFKTGCEGSCHAGTEVCLGLLLAAVRLPSYEPASPLCHSKRQ